MPTVEKSSRLLSVEAVAEVSLRCCCGSILHSSLSPTCPIGARVQLRWPRTLADRTEARETLRRLLGSRCIAPGRGSRIFRAVRTRGQGRDTVPRRRLTLGRNRLFCRRSCDSSCGADRPRDDVAPPANLACPSNTRGAWRPFTAGSSSCTSRDLRASCRLPSFTRAGRLVRCL